MAKVASTSSSSHGEPSISPEPKSAGRAPQLLRINTLHILWLITGAQAKAATFVDAGMLQCLVTRSSIARMTGIEHVKSTYAQPNASSG